MNQKIRFLISASVLVMGCPLFADDPSGRDAESAKPSQRNWWQWRGPLGTGEAPGGNPPTTWSETQNIRWKVELPGSGLSTPIIWGDRVYVQMAIPTDRKVETNDKEDVEGTSDQKDRADVDRRPNQEGREAGRDRGRRGGGERERSGPDTIHRFVIMALDRETGKTVWERTLRDELPHEGSHGDGSLAPSSPVTDGDHIFAYFGSRGLYALDMSGNVIWEKDFGDMRTRNGFGEGSSPALHGDTLVITWDHEDDSFIVALDSKSGSPKWKVDRDEPTSWATPVVVTSEGRRQVLVNGSNRMRGYDLSSGKLYWECAGMTANAIPTPVIDGDLAFFMSGFRGSALLAIDYANASGDIAGTDAVRWTYAEKGTPYVPSPLLYQGDLYFLDTNKAILSCVDGRTGQSHYAKKRLEEFQGVYASPVAADGRVYLPCRDGKTAVFASGAEFKLLATNSLDDSFSASPAIVGGQLFLRGLKNLYCIEGG